MVSCLLVESDHHNCNGKRVGKGLVDEVRLVSDEIVNCQWVDVESYKHMKTFVDQIIDEVSKTYFFNKTSRNIIRKK